VAIDRAFENQKIQILLAEYSGLKSIIAARATASIQGCAILLATLGVVVSQFTDHPKNTLILVAVAALILTLVGIFIRSDLKNDSAHLCRLEAEINRRAGEQLMTYETSQAARTVRILGRLGLKRRQVLPLPGAADPAAGR
jgi:hypothetical protein